MKQSSDRLRAARVLFVDDEPSVRRAFARTVKAAGYRVDLAVDGGGAIERARSHAYSIVALDFEMPGLSGIALVRQMRKLQPHAALLVITGDPQYAMESTKQKGVFMVISKPWESETLLTILEAACRRFDRAAHA
jgi:two-component system C4-dicarboxylate transport response regulator DctD